jgi:6-pyruvoyltetrahydropterin/6-carboxytetrahydropterin synthase
MLIRKSFKVNSAHIVRNCSSTRCKYSIHSHQTMIEVKVKSTHVDNGQMILDFGLFKATIGQFLKTFDDSYIMWDKESQAFKDTIYGHYERVIEIPVSPSAEMLSVVMYHVIDKIMKNTTYNNGESSDIQLQSVAYHETTSGYAESFEEDQQLFPYNLTDIKISRAIIDSMASNLWNELLTGIKFTNPIVEQQVS